MSNERKYSSEGFGDDPKPLQNPLEELASCSEAADCRQLLYLSPDTLFATLEWRNMLAMSDCIELTSLDSLLMRPTVLRNGVLQLRLDTLQLENNGI